MNPNDDRNFAQRQVTEMDRMLSWVGDHPLMAPALRQRRAEFAQRAATTPASPPTPRTVLFYVGEPVLGTQGVDADFAIATLGPFLEMVKTDYAWSKHGRVGQRGRRKDESEARLLITGTPRGSFGLELAQPAPEDFLAAQTLSATLVNLAELIRSTGESDEALAAAFDRVSPRLLGSLQAFLGEFAKRKAGLRMEAGDVRCELAPEAAARASQRAASTKTEEQRSKELPGVFRGATLDSWRFDFRTGTELISGNLAETVEETDVQQMNRDWINEPCVGEFNIITVRPAPGLERTRYELIRLRPRSSEKDAPDQSGSPAAD